MPTSETASAAVPTWSPPVERAVRVFAVLALGYTAYYIVWRWTASLNPDALWFAVPLAVAETYGFVSSLLFVFTSWKLERRTPLPPPPGLKVDVFITTYDEPLEILRRTAVAARDIRYPHRTYLLDDGQRESVRALAEELGIGYITRPTNEHAKAGNLNNALRQTDGEFILQLDADHVPLPHILDRLLGFFCDPRVAFVQSPQDFYNFDSFTHVVDEQRRRLFEEQRIFFSIIQPGKDHWNAAFFCGSCGVIRRAALEEIGGFSTKTVTEDMETSIILHARGWTSVYYGESLAYGLAPGSAAAFHVQRLRWGQGAMQIFRQLNPLTYPGLRWPQRLCYFASVFSYFDGLQKLVLYSAPIVFFLTGAFPIAVDDRAFLLRFFPYLVGNILMFELLARGVGYVWIMERYNMAKFFTYVLAITALFTRKPLRFRVTPKGRTHVPWRSYAPQLVLMAASILAVAWAMLAQTMGWRSYDVAGWGTVAFWANFAWLAWNFGVAGYVVQLSRLLQQQRADHRFADRFTFLFRHVDQGNEAEALCENLNGGGMAFRTTAPVRVGDRVEVELPLSTGTVRAQAQLVDVRPLRTGDMGAWWVRAVFEGLDLEDRDRIELHCVQHAVPIWQLRYRSVGGVVERTLQWFRNVRREVRRPVHLPCRIAWEELERRVHARATLEELSRSGARLLLDQPLPPGTRVEVEIPGTGRRFLALAVYAVAFESAWGFRYAVGLRRVPDVDPPRRRRLRRWPARRPRWIQRAERWLVPELTAVSREES